MCELRKQVLALLVELELSQRWLCSQINSGDKGYHVNPSEMSNALNGVLVTDKANRIVADSYSILTRERERRAKAG